jgi:hypothetical protein
MELSPLDQADQNFETAKAERMKARFQFEAAKGKLHMELMARRVAGEELTSSDMKAILADAINSDPTIKDFYLAFIKADSDYRAAKVMYEKEKRAYWDGKGR